MRRDEYQQVAGSVPFDNDGTDFDADNVQDALEEIGGATSPSSSLGRSANVGSGSWLLRVGSIPSNKTGVIVNINGTVNEVSCGSENLDTYTVSIYKHDGGGVNLTLLGSVSVTASRAQTFNVSYPVSKGDHLAALISAGSAKNVGVDFGLKGNP